MKTRARSLLVALLSVGVLSALAVNTGARGAALLGAEPDADVTKEQQTQPEEPLRPDPTVTEAPAEREKNPQPDNVDVALLPVHATKSAYPPSPTANSTTVVKAGSFMVSAVTGGGPEYMANDPKAVAGQVRPQDMKGYVSLDCGISNAEADTNGSSWVMPVNKGWNLLAQNDKYRMLVDLEGVVKVRFEAYQAGLGKWESLVSGKSIGQKDGCMEKCTTILQSIEKKITFNSQDINGREEAAKLLGCPDEYQRAVARNTTVPSEVESLGEGLEDSKLAGIPPDKDPVSEAKEKKAAFAAIKQMTKLEGSKASMVGPSTDQELQAKAQAKVSADATPTGSASAKTEGQEASPTGSASAKTEGQPEEASATGSASAKTEGQPEEASPTGSASAKTEGQPEEASPTGSASGAK